jgi:hypothetical protein
MREALLGMVGAHTDPLLREVKNDALLWVVTH